MKMPHIQLPDDLGVSYAVMPGDPARAERAAELLDEKTDWGMAREYRSISGTYKGTKVLVISTGMGGPSAAIAAEELGRIGVTAMIRIGSSGALKPFMAPGVLAIVTGAIRDDGTSRGYIDLAYPAIADYDLTGIIRKKAEELSMPFHMGICRSHDTMYSDRNPELYRKWAATPAIASDMETATLLTVASLRGIRAASILNTVSAFQSDVPSSVGRYADEEASRMEGERNEILLALESIHELDRKGKEEGNVR